MQVPKFIFPIFFISFIIFYTLAILSIGIGIGHTDTIKFYRERLINDGLAHYEIDAKTGETTFVINAEKK
jgi:hypothetical protein